jgi:hypothetical protein
VFLDATSNDIIPYDSATSTVALGTVTASAPLTFTQTWNNAGVTFTGVKLNVTSTASAAASLLMDLQVGGASQLSVKKDGTLTLAKSGGYGNGCLYFTGGSYFYNNGLGLSLIDGGGNGMAAFSATSLQLFNSNILAQDSASSLGMRNSTTAQTFNVYNTYTNSSNYERVALTWSSNFCYLTAQNAGTGSARNFVPVTGSVTVANLPAAATAGAGARLFVTDATSTTFLSTVAGGGANKVPVVSDGTNWLIG